jgi:restriction endonuclease S subunit
MKYGCHIRTPKSDIPEYWDGDIYWATLVDTKEKYLTSTQRKITKDGLKNSSAKLLPINTVIFSSRATIGATTIARIEVATNQGYKNFICNSEKLNYEYLYEVLKKYASDIELLASGTTFKEVSKNVISNFKIPLPPLAIQEEIVKECQKVDNEVLKANETIEQTKTDIENEINSVSGEMVKLGDITSKIGSGATPKGGESVYKESGITLIRSQNIYDDGFHLDGLAFIDEEQARKLDNVAVEENDILFNITGASVARCCIVESKYLPARVNQHVSIIRPINKIISQYLQKIITSESVKNNLITMSKASSTREAITKIQLENFKILLPSLEIQKQIVSKIEVLESKISEAKKVIDGAKKQKEAILKKYL